MHMGQELPFQSSKPSELEDHPDYTQFPQIEQEGRQSYAVPLYRPNQYPTVAFSEGLFEGLRRVVEEEAPVTSEAVNP